MRRGFTIVEVLVALLVSALVGGVIYEGILMLTRSHRSTDKETTRALIQARMMELLLKDLRSATAVEELPGPEYLVTRFVVASGQVVTRPVRWKLDHGTRVVRQDEGFPPQNFEFEGLLGPDEPAFRFRLERMPDVLFTSNP